MATLWIRCGEADKYQDMGPESKEANTLDNTGLYLANCGAVPPLIPVSSYGVIDENEFRGTNIIHVFWGDEFAEPVGELTIGELTEITIVLAHYGKYKLPY